MALRVCFPISLLAEGEGETHGQINVGTDTSKHERGENVLGLSDQHILALSLTFIGKFCSGVKILRARVASLFSFVPLRYSLW